MKPRIRAGRRGVALLGALVALALVSALLVTIGWRIIAHRRHETQRHNLVQATWLARAGVELAVDKLLSDPDGYKGETVELLPRSRVHIKVEANPDAANTLRVVSEAQYPTEAAKPVNRSLTRILRRTVDGGVARVEVVPEKSPRAE